MLSIVNNIFSVSSESFAEHALSAFRYGYYNNKVYKDWVDALKISIDSILSVEQIPFLPISFFKDHKVACDSFQPDAIFESSGTTATQTSKHYVKDLQLYIESCVKGFEHFYGDISEWCIVALLPSYLERQGSSLVVMVDHFIKVSGNALSGFYLYDHERLANTLRILEGRKQKTLFIGVTYALLDFAEKYPMQLNHTIIMETGGMKGKRKELIQAEVHDKLCKAFDVDAIHSEFGMTELLSQAYSPGNGIFKTVPWMTVLVRGEDDPLKINSTGRGVLNIIDLCNIYSCCFIATDDAAIIHTDGTFEILGRVDNSDVRGCSLLAL